MKFFFNIEALCVIKRHDIYCKPNYVHACIYVIFDQQHYIDSYLGLDEVVK